MLGTAGLLSGLALAVASPAPEIGFGSCAAAARPSCADAVVRSQYGAMKRDGIRIAIDLVLPRDLGAEKRLPAVLTPTRRSALQHRRERIGKARRNGRPAHAATQSFAAVPDRALQ